MSRLAVAAPGQPAAVTAPAAGEWQYRARCRGLPAQVFYPPDNEKGRRRRVREQRAKQFCVGCPVRDHCLDHALARPEPYGVWGATTPLERQRMIDARNLQKQLCRRR